MLPSTRSVLEDQQRYFQECLETNTVGSADPLTDYWKKLYEEWLEDEDILRRQALIHLQNLQQFQTLEQLESESDQIEAWLGGELPPPHLYRVRYDLGGEGDLNEADFSPETWSEILAQTEVQRAKLNEALRSGVMDNRAPLEPVRRAWFQKQIDDFVASDYPESIPPAFSDGECNVFGHICPVFFAAEAITETEEERRIGRRRLNFSTMMRIVRRDDYRCQHCQKKLQDNEVEFDHVIPISRGGSSEEHNIRLTCFDCNRDKSDEYVP